MDKDLYEILGVKKTATEGEIRKAFLKLAKKLHPDVNPNDKASEQKFKEVNFAYEVLKDQKKRAQYDQMRAVGANPFAQAGARGSGPSADWQNQGFSAENFQDMGLGDLFEEIFGGSGFGRGGRGRGSSRRGGFARAGQDRQSEITIGFLEAANGGERQVEFSDGRRLTVKIPAGVEDGQKIKLSGQGDPGINGGPAGALILGLRVAPHPYFTREGNNIVVKVPITFSESILGAEIEVPTLTGKVHLKIPRGVSSGQRLKLGGKGIAPRQGVKGDQFVELQIKVPKEVSGAYTEAAESLKNESFNPRQGLF